MYKEIRPGKWGGFVDSFWVYHNRKGSPASQLILPDGCIDLIFPLGPEEPRPMLVGCMSRAAVIDVAPGRRMFGLRFLPGEAAGPLRIDAREWTDRRVLLHGRGAAAARLPERPLTLDGPGPPPAVERLLQSLADGREAPAAVREAVWRINRSRGRIRVRSLAERMDLTIRRLQRLFGRYVGVSPKRLARIVRLRHAHYLLKSGGPGCLADAALEAGYHDQAHFNHEFKSLIGCSPLHPALSPFYNTAPPPGR